MERILGTMVGLAVGDALGVPVEFLDKYTILESFGKIDKMIGGGTWGQEPGTVSDDTDMALAVAEGIVAEPYSPISNIGKRFIDWYNDRPFDVGVCCSNVIRMAEEKEGKKGYVSADDWFGASMDYDSYSHGKSAGNGGLMRTAYVGAFYRDIRDVEKYAKEICKMTHWNKKARTDCALVSMIIHDLIEGGTKDTIEEWVNKYEDCSYRYDLGVIEGNYFYFQPNGFGENSLLWALRCVLTTDNFKDAVCMAVNAGGDTDTIGAITGAIAGALYGAEAIPKEWVEALDDGVLNRIINVSAVAALRRMA